MENLISHYEGLLDEYTTIDKIRENPEKYAIYPDSIYAKDNSILFISKYKNNKFLIVCNEGPLLENFIGQSILSDRAKICELDHDNANILRKNFPFTSPVSHRDHNISIGLGDRLGLASVGHIQLFKKYNAFPVLAQQSIRELTLTGRNYADVLDAASWSVFQEGYRLGFGADGDHLKSYEEVKMALDYGYTMITLDCSDHIDDSLNDLSNKEIHEKYLQLEASLRESLESKYLNKEFIISKNESINFNKEDFEKIVLIYLGTINFTTRIFKDLISPLNREIDFELSIDETLFTTSIESHFFIASELIEKGVKIRSLAPRFIGEFQKGIDYIGNRDEFQENFHLHDLIAKHFGYKISVHSGSDKFEVFPIVGKLTGGIYHLKTAGTNWLEATRVIASQDYNLFREIFKFAIKNLEKAKTYYHIKGNPNNLKALDKISDKDLVKLLDNDDARQILHITYGLILQEKDSEGDYVFKDRLFQLLNDNEKVYNDFLINHIGKHLEELGVEKIKE